MACTKKKATDENRPIVCGDASASLLPLAGRTYAPVGKPPVLKGTLTRDHLSVMGALTPEGQIVMPTQDHSSKGPEVVGFLPGLTCELPGQLLVIWDGASIPRGQAIKDSLGKGGAKRMPLERLPGSAPERKPQEGLLWRVERKHGCCLEVQHLQRRLRRAKERLRHRTSVLCQGFAHAGCFLSRFMLRSITF